MSRSKRAQKGDEQRLAEAESLAAAEAAREARSGATADGQPPNGPDTQIALSSDDDEAADATAEAAVPARPSVVNISQGGTDSIDADRVNIRQGGAGQVRTRELRVTQGGVGRADAERVDVSMGGIGLARAEHVSVRFGGIGAAVGRDIELHQTMTRLAAARDSVRMRQAGAMAVLANRVEMAPGSGAVFLLGRRVEGEGRVLFDWRAGVAFGVTFGVLSALFRMLRRR